MNAKKILIGDDDSFFCDVKKMLLEENGYIVDVVQEPHLLIDKIKSEIYDLILLDLKFKDRDGIDILKEIKTIDPCIMVIIITGFAGFRSAVVAMKAGAYDYISKDIENEELLAKIEKALEWRKDSLRIRDLEDAIGERFSLGNIIGYNPKMQEIYRLIETVCGTDVTVLIRGDTGTGKELIAKGIHFNSHRKGASFIPINCAAISEQLMESELFGHEKGSFTGAYKQKQGIFEIADKGTAFLDEIGDLPITLQAKLLRFLQDKTFTRVGGDKILTSDVRIIAATNKNLEDMIRNGEFREDLYYRINVIQIKIPPLRERIDDLPLLIDHFIKLSGRKFNKKIKGISEEGLEVLASYNWPGNIRELENLIERLTLITSPKSIITKGEIITHLAIKEGEKTTDMDLSLQQAKEKLEKEYITSLLKKYHGNIQKVAQGAKIDRKAIYVKMEKYGLKKEDFGVR